MSPLVQLLYGFGCMVVGALLYALVQFVSRERHPVSPEDGEEALRELRRNYYGDVRRGGK